MRGTAATQQDVEDWEKEMALWGISDPSDPLDETIGVWPENWEAMNWWLSIPSFLVWNFSHCVGMNVLAVKADAEMSGRDIVPDDYRRLKIIARTLTEELNNGKQ